MLINKVNLKVLIYLSLGFIMNISWASDTLIAKGSQWKYLDDGSNQGVFWRSTNFDDSNWQTGNAKLGFGDSNNATTLNNHQNPTTTGAATWYFRKEFIVNNPTSYNQVQYSLLRDDGAIVYLNGVELGRSNMPTGTANYNDFSSGTVGGSDETTYFPSGSLSNNLVLGTNVIAIEVHQRSLNSSDVGFDFELVAGNANLLRGPYLQSQSPTSVIVKWRTLTAVNSRVSWGTQLNNLNNFIDDANTNTKHEVLVSGLQPGSKIYYSIGTSQQTYAGNNDKYYFVMPPTHGTQQETRLWVIGDSGTANYNAEAVKNSYLQFTQNKHTNLWMMLGDNAYNTGTDTQYQSAVFDMYPELLRTSTLWSTIGNHDSANANSITQTGVYYDAFTLPTSANSDGISTGADSGTEAYYSFDYANIHIIVLESNQTNSTFRAGMISWLNNDLLVSNSDWLIAVWHHPPYTKGSHNSDTEAQLIYMRENINAILENKGVDLILGGHSHSYERSWLIDGHYGSSDSFDTVTHIINGTQGNPQQGEAYNKATLGSASHQGSVYVVAGSSGKTGGIVGDAHEAMRNKLPLIELGSLVIDVNARVMDVTFLNSNNTISDKFRITKGDIIFINGFELSP